MGTQDHSAGAAVRRTRSVSKRLAASAALALSLGLISAGLLATRASAESSATDPAFSLDSAEAAGQAPILLAQDGGTEPRELEPAYAPPDPGKPGPYNEAEGPGYNSDYLFGITRATVRSTIVPAAKVPLFLLTVPLDIALLPFAAIGGFFG
ncbi:MAG: hypothetical protein R3F21_05645 [Myxococcota bacterium]